MKNYRTAGIAASALVLTLGCSTDGGPGYNAEAASPVMRDSNSVSIVSRSEDFASLDALYETAEVAATVRIDGPVTPDKSNDEYGGMVNVPATVLDSYKGRYVAGDRLTLYLEGRVDEKGSETSKVNLDEEYLVFLTRAWPDRELFAITGFLSGLYEKLNEEEQRGVAWRRSLELYGKVDPESPDLPNFLTEEDLEQLNR